ncbi:hypothetical protein ACG873_27875 [Mesorhizobium sp. AaZ16]|uniref:hypothetical protein n=1 Tax=Mesorhizobium sp. AaZ16 TaxID=3402289 RepID=UPI00374E56FD
MQTIRHIPIEALPGASFIVQRQPKQRQDRIIDLVRVDLHPPSLARIARLPRSRPDAYIAGQNQQERMRQFGKVAIPQAAFIEALTMGDWGDLSKCPFQKELSDFSRL